MELRAAHACTDWLVVVFKRRCSKSLSTSRNKCFGLKHHRLDHKLAMEFSGNVDILVWCDRNQTQATSQRELQIVGHSEKRRPNEWLNLQLLVA